MKINLVKNGIFPITHTVIGNQRYEIPDLPDTGINLSGTVQGEGKLLGVPCLFIRTSGCNLRCAWVGADGNGSPCDTPYSSHSPEKNNWEVDDIVATIVSNSNNMSIRHVVVSGGEPLLQAEALSDLLMKLQWKGFHTTIETNATIYDPMVIRYTNLVSMSPKLSTSTPWVANLKNTGIEFNQKWAERHERDRINIDAIQSIINASQKGQGKGPTAHDIQLKFVVNSDADILEIKDIISKLKGVKPDDICLMPEGVTPEDLMNLSYKVIQYSLENGWRFTPRLHALLWGVKRGV